MKITTALTELARSTTAAAADVGDADVTTVAPSNADRAVLELLADSYVTIIVVVIIVIVFVIGLAVYKSCATWASTRTRRRHSSQSSCSSQHWLAADNPDMWAEVLDADGKPDCPAARSRSSSPSPSSSSSGYLVVPLYTITINLAVADRSRHAQHHNYNRSGRIR